MNLGRFRGSQLKPFLNAASRCLFRLRLARELSLATGSYSGHVQMNHKCSLGADHLTTQLMISRGNNTSTIFTGFLPSVVQFTHR